MSDPEKKICRYFNTLGGCWYGDSCKFLHIPNKKPPCKFYGSSTGCRYGESCHFSHDRAPFKSVENYSNASVEVIKEVFKENVNPTELSGTNNNNMTPSMAALVNGTGQQASDGTLNPDVLSSNPGQIAFVRPSANDLPDKLEFSTTTSTTVPSDYQALPESMQLTQGTEIQPTLHNSSSTAQGTTLIAETSNGNFSSVPLQATPNSYSIPGDVKSNQDAIYRDVAGGQLTMTEDGQAYGMATMNGRTNGVMNEMEILCGSCKRVVERRGNESYCTLLKDHYLECFLDKEGDHVKYVKTKAALEPGQMYWCKSCILIFEKPWSLFQHMADKAKGCKVQRWEKKIHLDWMDNVAGLMAGYDLGLFSPAKLRIDLRNLLADQHTMEEEMEVAAVTAAAMMQWLTPLSNPWRLQQREMMRKIEQLNRQMLRKANIGLNAVGAGYANRAALTAGPATSSSASSSVNYSPMVRNGSLPATPAPQRCADATFTGVESEDTQSKQAEPPDSNAVHISAEGECKEESNLTDSINDPNLVGPLGDGNDVNSSAEPATPEPESTGAAGDTALANNLSKAPKAEGQNSTKSNECLDTNNTNSAQSKGYSKEDFVGRRVDFKRGYHSAPSYGYGKASHMMGLGLNYRGFNDSMRYQIHSRGSRTPGYGPFHSSNHRMPFNRSNRTSSNANGPATRGTNAFNPPSFHASMDFNCGFTDDEVEELLSQGINPWDSEAPAALAVLRGELDHLLD